MDKNATLTLRKIIAYGIGKLVHLCMLKTKQQYNNGDFFPLYDEFIVELGPWTDMHQTINPYFVKSLEMGFRCPKQKRGESSHK
jgi:hypothetical protein